MKILAIRGKNLASLEGDFEIDFTQEPLKSAGLFAITGNTGSGKSTLLDAICLALFNATPRARQAPKREKANDDTLIGSDTRNILRRGTGEGFAEVDFLALNGDKYRSTWRVQRAHKNPSGKFQTETQRLYNLSIEKEEPLSRRDFPYRIQELIGLTFEQFTRAVLLAQGDFSTFLKAGEDEKAELLEKLTGTDIYSRISLEIHNKTKEAKEEYELIKSQIAHITLLTEKEIEDLNLQRETIHKDLLDTKKQIEDLDKSLNWLDTRNKYREAIRIVTLDSEAIRQTLLQSQPRNEYLKLIDLSLEIRKDFLDLKGKTQQRADHQKRLYELENSLKKNNENIHILTQQLETHRKEQEKIESRLKEITPVLEQITALDIRIDAEEKALLSAKNELQREEEKRKNSERKIKVFEEQIRDETANLQTIDEWFAKNETYKEIIPKADLIVGYLNQCTNYSKEKENAEKIRNQLNNQIELLKVSLEQKKEDEEKLNKILPAEILHWRKKLVKGGACPVCGSTEHPYTTVKVSSDISEIDEESLEKQKQQIISDIEILKKQIAQQEAERIEKDTLVTHYDQQYNLSVSSADEFLSFLPHWKEHLKDQKLHTELTLLASHWNHQLQLLNTKRKLVDSLFINLENEKIILDSSYKEYEYKQSICRSHLNQIEQLKEEIKKLSGDKNLKQISKLLNEEKERLLLLYEKIKQETDTHLINKSKIEGGIIHLQNDMEVLTKEEKQLNERIDHWIRTSSRSISREMLEDLTSQSFEWIHSEKEFLNSLKEKQIRILATLREREQQLTDHLSSPHRPEDGITTEELSDSRENAKTKESSLLESLTEIQVIFSRHKQDQATLDKYQKILTEKEESLENWQKLNYLLGSHDGSKFKRIAQGYTLDILLGYANKHLEQLSKRYFLKKIPNTLSLQVVDNDMLEEVRTVHSLSGGESFLLSLALALGLSSLSSQRMNIESLFIDEGFGSLDIDTLSITIDALENLQTQGKKIGVISHVPEMTERIPVQIKLIKQNNGKSKLLIKS
ncbi:MAG: AAA family ATPase [Bacteroidales bacterium]|nr:AAA family ATPase [Bacteroidales bacterium]